MINKSNRLALALLVSLAQPASAADRYPWVLDTANCTFPDYPREAARNEETGTTVLEFLIRTDGAIAATLVKTSSGSQALDMAAQDALAKCRFKLQVPVAPKEELWQNMAYVWQLEDSDGPLQRRVDFTTCARASYPAGARQRTMTGSLSLGLLVQPDGKVRETRLVRSSGHPELDSATRTAMAACRFLDGPARPTADEWVTMAYAWTEDDLPKQVGRNRK
jgi:TonB family protein